jgi:hypothetical protein
MKTYQFANALAATAAGAAVTIDNADGIRSGILQVEITTTASVHLQGRIDDTFSWVNVTDTPLTASGAVSVALFPNMRLNSTITAGTVSAKLFG